MLNGQIDDSTVPFAWTNAASRQEDGWSGCGRRQDDAALYVHEPATACHILKVWAKRSHDWVVSPTTTLRCRLSLAAENTPVGMQTGVAKVSSNDARK
jgi:hypothetical protein